MNPGLTLHLPCGPVDFNKKNYHITHIYIFIYGKLCYIDIGKLS